MKKHHITQRDRNAVSFVIGVIILITIYCDYKIEHVYSNTLQWVSLVLGAVIIIYFQFIFDPHQIESDAKDEYPVDSNDITIMEKESDFFHATSGHKPTANEKHVLVVQPMVVVSQEEFDKRIAPKQIEGNEDNIRMLNVAKEKELPVHTYTIHGVPKKYRAMVDDVHSFAIKNHKTYEQLHLKLLGYGYPFKVIKNGEDMVAFDLGFIRMPENGFFGIVK